MVDKSFEINIGGEELKSYDLKIVGDDCTVDDFIIDLIRFVGNWRNERAEVAKTTAKKPCGCKDAK